MYQKLKSLQKEHNLFDISAVERLCGIPQGSLSRALKRDQKTFKEQYKLDKLFSILEGSKEAKPKTIAEEFRTLRITVIDNGGLLD